VQTITLNFTYTPVVIQMQTIDIYKGSFLLAKNFW